MSGAILPGPQSLGAGQAILARARPRRSHSGGRSRTRLRSPGAVFQLACPSQRARGAPDELKIIDRRELAWPPSGERKPFWLIQYLARRDPPDTPLYDDDVGIGLVGSMTWCFFAYNLDERPPQDAYAIHCYWEMQHAKL